MYTVEDLIEALKQAPPDAEVLFCNAGTFWEIHVVHLSVDKNVVNLYNGKDLEHVPFKG